MISVEDNRNEKEDYIERSLFTKYLANRKNEGQRLKYLAKMKEYLEQIKIKKVSSTIEDMRINLSFQPGEFDCDNRIVFQYYFAVWLKNMGYKSEHNKKMMLEKLHLILPKHLVLHGVKFYDHLGQGFLSGLQRFSMLEEICANGWEFFCRVVEAHLQKCE